VTQGNPSPSDTPAGAEFPAGFIKFNVTGLAVGGSTTVQIILPTGVTPNAYWKFGPEPGKATPHWYEFEFDGTTGAQFSANVITLNFVDGLRGDADLTADGVITDPGAPAVQTSIGDTSGTGDNSGTGGPSAQSVSLRRLRRRHRDDDADGCIRDWRHYSSPAQSSIVRRRYSRTQFGGTWPSHPAA